MELKISIQVQLFFIYEFTFDAYDKLLFVLVTSTGIEIIMYEVQARWPLFCPLNLVGNVTWGEALIYITAEDWYDFLKKLLPYLCSMQCREFWTSKDRNNLCRFHIMLAKWTKPIFYFIKEYVFSFFFSCFSLMKKEYLTLMPKFFILLPLN